MPLDAVPASWGARLALGFERRSARTVLASRSHEGPLVVQKPFHPEGDAICHAIVVHPPGGIAGGDALSLDVHAGAGAHALITTPGAGKWYRSGGPWARQDVRIDAAAGASLEWLPQETIVFDGARAELRWHARLAPSARLIAWDVRVDARIERGDRALWVERGLLEPGSPALASPVGLAGHSVSGTFLAAGIEIADDALAACRGRRPEEGEGAVTRLPHLLVARYRGDCGAAARAYFTALWRIVRPHGLGVPAVEPRIWQT
jgi:urease accessory protein